MSKRIHELTNEAAYAGGNYVEVDDAGWGETRKQTCTVLTSNEAAARAAQDDVIEAGAGLNANGTYTPNPAATYISAATSLKDADTKLDTALKALSDSVGALAVPTFACWSISAGTFRALNSLPQTLIPAPGAGKFLFIHRAIMYVDYTAPAFNPGTDPVLLRYLTSNTTIATFTNATVETTADKIEVGLLPDNAEIEMNEGVQLYCASDSASGASTVYIYIEYEELDIATASCDSI